jgi:hypothetical protein
MIGKPMQNATAETMLVRALSLAAQGFHLFPIVKGTKVPPAGMRFKERATRDPEHLRQWFSDDAFDIGIYTGRFGDDEALVVLDVDVKKTNGHLEVLRLELAGYELPVTRKHNSPSGGAHYFFRHKVALRQGANVVGPSLDIRSAGGYVVAYPGDELPVAALPEWLILKLGTIEPKTSTIEPIVDAPSAPDRATHYLLNEAPLSVEGEGGDDTAFRVAARVKDFGVTQAQAFDLLAEHWNERCSPPWSPDELGIKVHNAYQHGKNPPGISAPEAVFKPVIAASEGTDDIDFVDFASLAHRQPPPREWVVDEYVPRRAVAALFGPGGHGKSLVAQQLASSVANGKPWIGLNVATGPVLGIFCEDDRDEMLRRGNDIFNNLGLAPTEGSENLYLDARAGKPNAMVTFTQARNPVEAPLLKRLREYISRLRPTLVILDNIAQIFAGQENVRGEVTPFVNILTGLAIEFDCAILLLGHTAKAEGSQYSGSTAWDAAVRSRLLLERNDDGTSTLKKLKANYSALDERRLEWRQGVFHDVPAGAQLTPETIEANKQIVLQALATFTTRQQACSNLPTARNFLGTLMRKENMIGKSPLPAITATINALVEDGTLLINQQLAWKTGSRHWATGLVQA